MAQGNIFVQFKEKCTVTNQLGKEVDVEVTVNYDEKKAVLPVGGDAETTYWDVKVANLRYAIQEAMPTMTIYTSTLVSWWSEDRSKIYMLKVKQDSSSSIAENLCSLMTKYHSHGSTGWVNWFKPNFINFLQVAKKSSPAQVEVDFVKTYVVSDMEAISMYKENVGPGFAMESHSLLRFSKEERNDSIEKVEAWKNQKAEIIISTKEAQYIIDLTSKTAIETNFMDCLKVTKSVLSDIFTDSKAFAAYIASIEINRRNKGPPSGNLPTEYTPSGKYKGMGQASSDVDWGTDVHISDLNRASMESLIDQYTFRGQANETLAEIWAPAELQIAAMEKDGLIPGIAVASGGLDPNNADHLRRAFENIRDTLLEAEYDRAAATAIGVKEEFSQSQFTVVKDFFKHDIIHILKNIFMRSLLETVGGAQDAEAVVPELEAVVPELDVGKLNMEALLVLSQLRMEPTSPSTERGANHSPSADLTGSLQETVGGAQDAEAVEAELQDAEADEAKLDLENLSMEALIEHYTYHETDHMNQRRAKKWAVAESAIMAMQRDGLVPGVAVSSLGLNPDNPEHLNRALENIRDTLMASDYRRAASTAEGVKEEFSQSRSTVVRDYFQHDTIHILKNIFMRRCRQQK